MRKTLFLFVFLLFFAFETKAWNSTGHMIHSALAYQQLSPGLKQKVNQLLHHHPNYQVWKSKYQPNQYLDLDTFIFMRCSFWADEIRGSKHELDHLNWHFVNYPFTPPKELKRPHSPLPDDDILVGIQESERVLRDKHASPEEKAMYLAMLIHLLGDLHQPLHCIALINQKFHVPDGDKGGNETFLKADGEPLRIHKFWDDQFGPWQLTLEPSNLLPIVSQLNQDYPKTKYTHLFKKGAFQDWSFESYHLAVQYAYLGGTLPLATHLDQAPQVTMMYMKNANRIAKERVTLGAYRLAQELEYLLQ